MSVLYRHEGDRCAIFGDSLADVQSYINSSSRKWSQHYSQKASPSNSWDLNAGYDTAMRLAKEGWSEGALNLHDELGAIPPPVNKHYDLRYNVGGHFPDVPRYLAGEPAHMVTRGKHIGNPPVVHIIVNAWVLAAIRANEFRNYGTAITAMIDKLESTGRRVELDVVFKGLQHHKYHVIVGWKVKSASEHCDLSAVAFSLAHPAAFRRLGFALVERSPEHWSSHGYGVNGYIKREDAELIGSNPEALLIDGVGSSRGACQTLSGAVEFAAGQINKAAGEELVTLE